MDLIQFRLISSNFGGCWMNTLYFFRSLRFILVVGITFLVFYLLYFISSYTYPFIIAFFIAFIINPIVNFVEYKGKIPRGLAVIIVLLFIFSIFIAIITLLIAEIVSGTEYLARVLPHHIETLVGYIEDFIKSQIIPFYNHISNLFDNLETNQQETIIQNIENIGQQLTISIGTFLQNFFSIIPAFLSWFPNAATVVIFSLLATFFISKDWYRLQLLAGKFMPEKAKKSGHFIFIDLKRALIGFMKAQFTLISITTVIVLIGLLILKVDYAITISLLIGFVDLLPYLGTGLIFVPWMIYEFVGGSTHLGIGLLVLYIVVLVQRQLIEPKVLSTNIGLNPLATLIAIFVGFKLFGFLGLIIGPVSLVFINTLYRAHVFHDIWAFIKGA
jgi:sporulation integral membrane protein YtvI